MSLENIITGFQDQFETPITSMGSNFVTIGYELGVNLHLGIHTEWDAAVTGVMYLEYTGDRSKFPTSWVPFNAINVDSTMRDLMFLDANLAIARFRLRWEVISGNANLTGYIVRKRG